MAIFAENLSIIIPLAPDEDAHEALLQDLRIHASDAQIITSSKGTRVASLNEGAAQATGDFLWFLHADSRVDAGHLMSLQKVQGQNALYYFDLAYEDGGTTIINAWAANMRALIFGLPYGDQGFCISKTLFNRLGGYPDFSDYGEDVLFIRKAKRARVRLQRIPYALRSSPRAYRQHGWLRLTFYRQLQLLRLLWMAL